MLKENEYQFIDSSNFTLIRKDAYFIEFKSNATGHCWSVFSNQFDVGGRITLYHKKYAQKSQYELYSKCDSVFEAVVMIKEYEHQLLELQDTKNQDGMASTIRRLKVYESSGYKYKPIPSIILKGEWLKNCGFEIGQELDVKCGCEGELIIKKVI